MNLFEEVKKMVPIKTVATAYGAEIKNNGMALCPFHNDHAPSMKFYDRNYHCFGCGAHGDAIDYVKKLFGISNYEAAMKLNSDFNLGINNCNSFKEDVRNLKANDTEKSLNDDCKTFSLAVRELRSSLIQAKEILDGWKYSLRPKSMEVPPESWDSRFVMSCICSNRIDYFIDLIDFGERWEIEKLLGHKKEVIEIVERIKSIERNPVEECS